MTETHDAMVTSITMVFEGLFGWVRCLLRAFSRLMLTTVRTTLSFCEARGQQVRRVGRIPVVALLVAEARPAATVWHIGSLRSRSGSAGPPVEALWDGFRELAYVGSQLTRVSP